MLSYLIDDRDTSNVQSYRLRRPASKGQLLKATAFKVARRAEAVELTQLGQL